nr:uncharacterized protein CI109_004351 [Kwoniella shandongensis]KAA5527291.1 hypothetical protein CI109_004351 [Kwoniella shandongensis]
MVKEEQVFVKQEPLSDTEEDELHCVPEAGPRTDGLYYPAIPASGASAQSYRYEPAITPGGNHPQMGTAFGQYSHNQPSMTRPLSGLHNSAVAQASRNRLDVAFQNTLPGAFDIDPPQHSFQSQPHNFYNRQETRWQNYGHAGEAQSHSAATPMPATYWNPHFAAVPAPTLQDSYPGRLQNQSPQVLAQHEGWNNNNVRESLPSEDVGPPRRNTQTVKPRHHKAHQRHDDASRNEITIEQVASPTWSSPTVSTAGHGPVSGSELSGTYLSQPQPEGYESLKATIDRNIKKMEDVKASISKDIHGLDEKKLKHHNEGLKRLQSDIMTRVRHTENELKKWEAVISSSSSPQVVSSAFNATELVPHSHNHLSHSGGSASGQGSRRWTKKNKPSALKAHHDARNTLVEKTKQLENSHQQLLEAFARDIPSNMVENMDQHGTVSLNVEVLQRAHQLSAPDFSGYDERSAWGTIHCMESQTELLKERLRDTVIKVDLLQIGDPVTES